MLPDLDRFLEALHDKTWIEILTATQDEICKLSRHPRLNKLDPLAAYLASLKEFEAYLLNPTDPLLSDIEPWLARCALPRSNGQWGKLNSSLRQKQQPIDKAPSRRSPVVPCSHVFTYETKSLARHQCGHDDVRLLLALVKTIIPSKAPPKQKLAKTTRARARYG